MLQIIEVQKEEDLPEIKRLFEEYADSLEINLDFQGFQEELTGLPGVLRCRTLRRTVQVRLGSNPAVSRDGCPVARPSSRSRDSNS